MLELSASLFGGTFGLVLGLILQGRAFAARIEKVRKETEEAWSRQDWSKLPILAAELEGLEKDAKSLIGQAQRILGGRGRG
ncbi:MAG: hypothetical protein MH204_01160 [Fimbriimonadaceae bacterium]|nr:hypothetical protein [Fimbriimonadaceae bacterium]